MRSFVGAITQKISTLTVALVLVFSSIAATLPLFLGQIANAAPNTTYTATNFTDLSWGADRRAPSGGQSVAASQLRLTVDGDNPAPNSHQKFEGLKASLPTGVTSVSADLYVDPAWSDKTVIAGIWAQANNGTYDAWPTLEFANDGGSAVIEVFNTFGGSIEGVTNVSYGDTVNLEIAVNPVTNQFTYYLDDNPIFSSASGNYKPLISLIFNNYNNGVVGNDYTTQWSNLRLGTQNTEAPSNLNFFKGATEVPADSTINYTDVQLRWSTVANAERYQVRVTNPTGDSQANRYTGWYTFDLSDATRHGHFGSMEGTWKYEVRTKDATTGLWSDYTTPISLVYDSEKPTVALTAPTSAVISNSTSIVLEASDNIALKQIDANIYKVGQAGVFKPVSAYSSGPVNGQPSYTHVINITGFGEGDYYIKFNASDQAGNKSSTTTFNFTVDNTAPNISWQLQPLAYYGIGDSFHVRPITSEVGTTKSIYFDEVAPETLIWTLTSDHKNFDTKNTHNQTLWDSLGDGTHVFIAVFTDHAGNSTTSYSNTFIVDRTSPTADLQFPVIGQSGTSFKVVFSENVNSDDATNPANYFLNNWPGAGGSGDLVGDATITYDASTWTATINFTNADWYISPEQEWGVKNVRDLAGNVIAETREHSTPLAAPTDPGAPVLTTALNQTNASWSWAASTDIGGSGVAWYEYSLDGGSWVSLGADTTSLTTLGLAEGSHTLSVRSGDNAGLVSGIVSTTVTLDFTAPTVGVNSITTTDTTPTITGTVNDPTAVVRVTINGNTHPAVNNGNGTWTLANWPHTLSAAVTPYTVAVEARDGANNPGTASGTVMIEAILQEVAGVSTFNSNPTSPNQNPNTTVEDDATEGTVNETDGQTLAATTTAGDTVTGSVDEGEAGNTFSWWWLLAVAAALFFIIAGWRKLRKSA